MKQSKQRWIWQLAIAATFTASACSYKQEKPYTTTTLEDLNNNAAMFDTQRVSVVGCIRAHPHGIVMVNCPPGQIRIPLEASDEHSALEVSNLHARALRSQVDGSTLPRVRVYGELHLANNAMGRWIRVESIDQKDI